MRPIPFAFSALLLVSTLACASEPAADDAAAAKAEVTINSMRNPELKRYRVMAAGLDAFDEHRGKLAPGASLRFGLLQRGAARGEKASFEGLTLRLAGNEFSQAVPVAPDGTFALERNQAAHADDADLVLNRPKGSLRYSVNVRSPGLAANVIRLGDMRLECQVMMGIAKQELNFLIRSTITTLLLTSDWCSAFNKKKFATFAARLDDWALSGVRIRQGQREQVDVAGYQFLVPFADETLDHDTLFEFEYWSSASPERKRQYVAQWPIGFASSIDKWKSNQTLAARENGVFGGTVALKAGKWKFSLGSPKGEIKLGAKTDKTAAAPGAELPLAWHGYDLTLDVAKEGNYAFTLDLRDLERPLLKLGANPLQ